MSKYYTSKKEAEDAYNEYLQGHIGNVKEALELLNDLNISFVVDNYDELKEICSHHDESKYEDEEYIPYREHFYPLNADEEAHGEAFDNAVEHHIKSNKHHWNYWMNDDGSFNIPDENEYKLYCIERCCDWLAMANQHGEEPTRWYNINKDAIKMPDYGHELCNEVLKAVPEDFKLSFTGTRGELDESTESLNEYAYEKDVTSKELDRNHVMLITYNDGERHVNDFGNITRLFEYIKQCGGLKSFKGIQYTIMSDYKDSEFYLVRDRYHKSGWVWEDVNGDKVDSSDVQKRFKNILESDYWKTLEPKIEDTENDRKDVETYKEKIKNGFSRPILVNKDGEILDGNHTMTAYQELGIKPKELYTGERSDFYKAVAQTKGDAEKAIHIMIDNGTAKLMESSSKSKKQILVDLVSNASNDEVQSILYYLVNDNYVPNDTKQKGKSFILNVIKNNYVDEPSTSYQKKNNTNLEIAICNGTHKDRSEYLTEEDIKSLRKKIVAMKGQKYLDGIDKNSNGHAGYYALLKIVQGLESKQGENRSKQSDRGEYNKDDSWKNLPADEIIRLGQEEEDRKMNSLDESADMTLDDINTKYKSILSYPIEKFKSRQYADDKSSSYITTYHARIKSDKDIYAKSLEDLIKELDKYSSLTEATLTQLKRTALNQDPTRVKKSKHVYSKYIGISKYGVLNFSTTSEEHSGVNWYQEILFPSFNGLMNIVEQGDEIDEQDVRKILKQDNIKLTCDDPSFGYWSWKYKAYRDGYGLEKETRAPKRNNTRLKGSTCKHCISVIELLNQSPVIKQITQDLNEWCKKQLGMENNGYQDAEGMMNKDLKANQYDYSVENVIKSLISKDKFEKYQNGTPLEDLNLTDQEMKDVEEAIKGMRDRSQFDVKSELEKQFEPVKRGRKITRADKKLSVGSDEESEE